MSEAPSRSAVVTGAAGWLGQNLVRSLASSDRAVIRCLVQSQDEAALLEVLSERIQPVVGDVRDPQAIEA
ncbi:MAG: SDR family oxidoreductase, partial [Acidimicrobiales bacterium]|nr:SDR family oxidoreductase [Acidimicrobiales bacterium]